MSSSESSSSADSSSSSSSKSDSQLMPPPDPDWFLHGNYLKNNPTLFIKIIYLGRSFKEWGETTIDFSIPHIQLDHPEWEFGDIPLLMLQAKIKESMGLNSEQYKLYTRSPYDGGENLNEKFNANIANFRSLEIVPGSTLYVVIPKGGGRRKRKSRLKKKRTKKRRRKTKRRVKRRRRTRRR